MHLRVTQRAGLYSVWWLACCAHLLPSAYSSVNIAQGNKVILIQQHSLCITDKPIRSAGKGDLEDP